MGVHRISDRAEALLQDIAKREGRKPSEVLNDLVVDYHAGLTFDTGESPRDPCGNLIKPGDPDRWAYPITRLD